MTVDSDFVATVMDLLSPWDGVSARRMFGGYGIYRQGLMFGLVVDDVLYLKADNENRPAFEAAGMGPFTYDGKGRRIVIAYYEAPSELFDDSEAMLQWAKGAFAAALRVRKPAQHGRKRPKRPTRNITKI